MNNPSRKQLPRLVFLLMAMRWPLAFWFVQNFIKKYIPNLTWNSSFSYGFECQFGNINAHNVWLGDTIFNDHEFVNIWAGTRFSAGNRVITGVHDLYDFGICHNKEINIGKSCWITTWCIILAGVNIWDNVIIWAWSVVKSNIPSNCIAVWNPCVVVKQLDPNKIKVYE